MKFLKKSASALALACVLAGATVTAAVAAPQAELHVWGGNTAEDSGDFGLRSAEVAYWATDKDRIGLRYDNSLSQDNAQLARLGIDAEAYFLSYLKDFDGKFLLQGEIGTRDLPAGADQMIYKGEGVFFNGDGTHTKLGAQLSRTDDRLGDFDDVVLYGAYNFAGGEGWRLEPQLYVSQTGRLEDKEWRVAGYAEYTAPEAWQVGLGMGYGDIDSDLARASGEVFNAHARLSVPINDMVQLHTQVRYEDAPTANYTVGLVGFSVRLNRE